MTPLELVAVALRSIPEQDLAARLALSIFLEQCGIHAMDPNVKRALKFPERHVAKESE